MLGNPPPLSRVTGCLLGGAVGDALGYPIEFIGSAADITRTYGASPPGLLAYARRPAVVSDDTQMTLFTAEGLIRAAQRRNDRGGVGVTDCVLRAYQRWLATQDAFEAAVELDGWLVRERRLWHRRAPGNSCLSALCALAGTARVPTVEDRINDSKGCGGIMRSAPFGLVTRDRSWAFREARDAAALTHGHPSGYLSAAYFAAVICDVAQGAPLPEAMNAADALLAREPQHEETANAVVQGKALAAAGPPSPEAIEGYGGGWVGEEALAISLAVALTTAGPSSTATAEALWRAVAHGGDSDSTGSMVGNLLGAMHGVECLPTAWVAEVDLRDVVERVARDLHAAVAS